MSDLIERIKQSVKEHSYPIVHGINNHDVGMTVQGFYQVLDEESTKEQQEEPKCSEYTRESIQAECVLDGCKFHAKEPQECEWNYDGDGYYLHGNDWISGKSDFKYCPYCGKKVKVIDHD